MSSESLRFHESNLWSTPIRDLELTIKGTRLEPILAEFEEELSQAGISRIRPRWYLSTEWGVPFETIAVAIPFYLAHPELTALHAERVGDWAETFAVWMTGARLAGRVRGVAIP